MNRDAHFICEATGGELVSGPNSVFGDVSIDTRTITPGAAFFCLKGPNFDGHQFAQDALGKGASLLIVERTSLPSLARLPDGLHGIVAVDDTERALAQAAAAWRRAHDVKVVGLTGSSGKTTTKEMVDAVLGSHGPTLATRGNLNNHLGVPLTLFRLSPEHQFAVIEMGMNAPGEIAYLAELSQPSVGVVTTVGQAHTEGVGSLDGVADAKGELLRALPSDGLGIIPSGIDRRSRLTSQVSAKLETVGEAQDDVVRLARYDAMGERASGEVLIDQQLYPVSIELSGRYNLDNAMLALAVGRALGVSMEDAISALGKVAPPALRGEIRTLADKTEVVLDCYNANPQSMRAAVGTFVQRHPNGVLALGDMLELGVSAEEEHAHLGEFVANLDGQPELVGVGRLSQHTVNGALGAGMQRVRTAWYSDAVSAANHVGARCSAGRALLLKGSRGMRMERIFEVLSQERGQ